MIFLGTGVGTAFAESNWREMIKWQTYNSVQPEKSTLDRKIFIYFFSKRCGYCRKLEKTSFSDSTIADYINKNYQPILVNIDKERQLAMRFGINGVPNLHFFTPNNEPIAQLPGYVPSDTLFNLLQYIQTDSYKTMALNDFIKKKGGN